VDLAGCSLAAQRTTLDDEQPGETKLKKGDNLIFAAFGGGFNWGSIYLKWAYNS
jgi:3-oxoacyl-[acyl-carrier-protein] synthase III